MKLAQVTFHNAQNCGAVLQAWALQTALMQLGYNAFLPDCNRVGAFPGHFKNITLDRSSVFNAIKWCAWYLLTEILSFVTDELKDRRFKRFIRKHMKVVRCGANQVASLCDAAVFGSDQIWNPKWTGDETGHFLGESLPPNFPKIAYGVSIGDTPLKGEDAKRVSASAKSFNAISLREALARDILCDKQGRKPSIVCDPTLLVAKEEYLKIASSKQLERCPYLLFFSLRGDEKFERSVRSLARQLMLKCVIVNMTQKGLWRCRPNTKIAVSPDLLLAYLRDAKYVVTDSFHGTALSIILGKQFISLKVADTTPNGRIATLLSSVGISDRLVDAKAIEASAELLTTPVSTAVVGAVDSLRQQSIKWLAESLAELRAA